MDEILIEEKRYISSKRAAKITGYAKDYVGQLCREGRVPARLVGRGWYVLESAIADHRFGNQEIETSAPESPKYEASPVEILPPISRSDEIDEEVVTTPIEDGDGSDISDSWREWFDRVSSTETQQPITTQTAVPIIASVIENSETEKETAVAEVVESSTAEEEKSVEIPIHAIYRQPPQELLPHNVEEERSEEPEQLQTQQKAHKVIRVTPRAIQACGIALATIMVTLAVAGSGYLDKYIISASPVSIIAGVTLYNK